MVSLIFVSGLASGFMAQIKHHGEAMKESANLQVESDEGGFDNEKWIDNTNRYHASEGSGPYGSGDESSGYGSDHSHGMNGPSAPHIAEEGSGPELFDINPDLESEEGANNWCWKNILDCDSKVDDTKRFMHEVCKDICDSLDKTSVAKTDAEQEEIDQKGAESKEFQTKYKINPLNEQSVDTNIGLDKTSQSKNLDTPKHVETPPCEKTSKKLRSGSKLMTNRSGAPCLCTALVPLSATPLKVFCWPMERCDPTATNAESVCTKANPVGEVDDEEDADEDFSSFRRE